MWPWQPKTDPNQHRPMCPQLSLSGRTLPCCGFGAWSLLGPKPNPNPTLNQDPHQILSMPRTLTLQLIRLLARALTLVLEGDYETNVASALSTSLDRTLRLAKALSPWDPIPTSDNTTRLGSRNSAG